LKPTPSLQVGNVEDLDLQQWSWVGGALIFSWLNPVVWLDVVQYPLHGDNSGIMSKILVDFHALFAECRFGDVMNTEAGCSGMRKSWTSFGGQTINSSHLVP
jgi:hypothetical protein